MGGFLLVEPFEASSTPSEANTSLEGPRTSDAGNVPPTDTFLVDEDRETLAGRAPFGNKSKGRVTILTLEMLQELVKDPEFEIQVTEDEIMDRSKGDELSKIIFILQTSWFITQCVVRRTQGLSLTQLELTTLALASLNGVTFILWWHKPLNVRTPVRVDLKRKLTVRERKAERVSRFLLQVSERYFDT